MELPSPHSLCATAAMVSFNYVPTYFEIKKITKLTTLGISSYDNNIWTSQQNKLL